MSNKHTVTMMAIMAIILGMMDLKMDLMQTQLAKMEAFEEVKLCLNGR